MWRCLYLLGLCGALCSGCTRPSTSQPSQFPSPASTPVSSTAGPSTPGPSTSPPLAEHPPMAPLVGPMAPVRSLGETAAGPRAPATAPEASVDLMTEQELETRL